MSVIRLLILFVLILLFLFRYELGWRGTDQLINALTPVGSRSYKESSRLEDLAKRQRRCFWISPKSSLRFNIPPWSIHLKVLSHAVLKKDTRIDKDQRWPYSVFYRLFDENGKILLEDEYYHRGSIGFLKQKNNGRELPRQMLTDDPRIVCDGRSFTFRLSGFGGRVRSIELQVGPSDPDVVAEAISVYAEGSTPRHRRDVAWLRLSQETREKLSRGNLFPHYLLREQEKLNLVSTEWKPLGPVGVAGTDWEEVRIHLFEESEELYREHVEIAQGLFVHEGGRATVAIPPGGGNTVFSFEPVAPPASENLLPMLWFHHPDGILKTSTVIPLTRTLTSFAGEYPEGLLEFQTDRNLYLQVYFSTSGQPVNFTPDPMRVPGYDTRIDDPIQYSIEHIDEDPVPFRLSFRGQSTPANPVLEFNAQYSFYDNDNQLVTAGNLLLVSTPSSYDYYPGRNGELIPGESNDIYFYLSSPISKALITSSPPMTVSAYCRPDDFTGTFNLRPATNPGDFRDFPSWFSFYPENPDRLSMQGRYSLISLPLRPPSPPSDATPLYEWKGLTPEGDPLLRDMLVPVETDEHVPARLLPVLYSPVNRNQKSSVVFSDPYNRNLSPTLCFIRETSEVVPVSLSMNHRDLFASMISGERGFYSLPDIPAGSAELELQAPDGRWLVSSAVGGTLIRRSAHRVENKLVANIKKEEAKELRISGRLYLTHPDTEGRVCLELEGPHPPLDTPLSSLNFREKIYSFITGSEGQAEIFGAPYKRLYPSPPFTLIVDAEAPNGNYRFEMQNHSGKAPVASIASLVPVQQNKGIESRSILPGNVQPLPKSRLSLEKLYSQSRKGTFLPVTPAEARLAEDIFLRAFMGERGGTLSEACKTLGLTALIAEKNENTWLVIQESTDSRRGRGFFAISDRKTNLLVMAPHSRYDLYTGEIAMNNLEYAEAFFLNTVHRYSKKTPQYNSDLCDLQNSYLNAFTRAWARTRNQGVVLQLHGFSYRNHEDLEAKGVEVVLSSGADNPSPLAVRLAQDLNGAFPEKVLLHKSGLSQLGGTLNAQAHLLQGMNYEGFLHLEMSKDFRLQLLRDKAFARKLFERILP